MKILSIGPAYPLRGGIAKFNESLCENLQKAGHQLVLFSYKYQYPSFLFPGKTQYSKEKSNLDLNISEELHSVNFLSWKKTAERIIREKPDLLIIHYWMPFFALQLNFILRIITRKNLKIILLAHNLIPHEKQPGTITFTRKLLSRINGLVCLSASVKKDALSLRPDLNCLVHPHPVYDIYGDKTNRIEAANKLNLDPQFRYILFFGLIRDYKGLDLLLKAMPGLERQDVKLIVAGEFYGKKEVYTKLIFEEKIEDRVILTDSFIPDSEVKYYFSLADLVVQPYKSATQSGVTQIAYHFNNPMIVTRVGGLPEIVDHGKTGFVVDTDHVPLAEAMNTFYNENLLEEFSSNVKNKKSEFSWEYFTKKLLGFSQGL